MPSGMSWSYPFCIQSASVESPTVPFAPILRSRRLKLPATSLLPFCFRSRRSISVGSGQGGGVHWSIGCWLETAIGATYSADETVSERAAANAWMASESTPKSRVKNVGASLADVHRNRVVGHAVGGDRDVIRGQPCSIRVRVLDRERDGVRGVVGERLSSRESSGVRGRLLGSLLVVPDADVDDEARHPEQAQHREHNHRDHLAALAAKPRRWRSRRRDEHDASSR